VTGLARSTIWSSYASMALCILSHGGDGVIYGTNWEPVRMNNLKYAFNHEQCPELSGKPKMFIIQACRGERYMSFDPAFTWQRPSEDKWQVASTLAPIRDTLDLYATLSEFVSFRNEQTGKLLAANRWEMISNRSIGQVLSSFKRYALTCRGLARTAEMFTMSFTMLKNKWLPKPYKRR
jgi:Caspase domain